MPIANVEKTKAEIIHLIGCKEEDIILASAKTGVGVEDILKAVIAKVPAPKDNSTSAPHALIFDSEYNEYKGVVASVRVVDGELKKGDKIFLMTTETPAEILEIGYYRPKFSPTGAIKNGEIGYVVTGLKEVRECRVGDTITTITNTVDMITASKEPLPGYKEVKPMVFTSL